ncbi:hypothetical protein [Chamaesiphon sp. VAR_69_metabat_338]|uniref:hypothetical protein n=1 Tax=Chamaesiphon sp. VAR_69_metabat_338 TaxID=2964704 RepID=UPI00286DAD5C|nr:hypothetical protein [Chamaesiphon sp. VAR_69_metabat_338]
MIEQGRKQQIQHKVLCLATCILSFLGTGGFAVYRGLSVYHINEQYNEQVARLGAKSTSVIEYNDSSIKIIIEGLDRKYYEMKNVSFDDALALMSNRKMYIQESYILKAAISGTLMLFILVLFGFYRLRGVAPSVCFACYFSEEIVAELSALRERLTNEQKLTWLIRFILFYQILTLVWGIYIQINIDNLTLPSRDRRIDK